MNPCNLFNCVCSKVNNYALSEIEEEMFLANCSSFSGVKYAFKATWKSFLILYSLHGSQNYKPIACICLVLAFIASIIGISIVYDLQPFNDRLPYNPGGFALEWPQTITDYKLYTFITCIFIHINVTHVFTNAALLLFCGIYLEVKYGHSYLIVVFFTSAIFGEFGQFFMNTLGRPYPWTSSHAVYVGSSTGVMGVMGVFVAETFIAIALDTKIIKYIYFKYVSTFLLTATFIAETIYAIWYQEMVAVWMHIYGFCFGFIVLSVAISFASSFTSSFASSFTSSFTAINKGTPVEKTTYIELKDMNYMASQNEITIEDIDTPNFQDVGLERSIEEINTDDESGCLSGVKRHYKKLIFLAHFSIAIIYSVFVVFSIWRVFTFQ